MAPAVHKTTRGTYEVRSQIGQGTWGAVFLADFLYSGTTDAKTVPVAVKTSLSKNGVTSDIEGFKLALKHIPGYTVGMIDYAADHSAVVMEVVENGSLYRLLQTKEFQKTQLPTLLDTMAEILLYGSQSGFTHGDMKPENILIQKDGKIVLCDFALSCMEQDKLYNKHPYGFYPAKEQQAKKILGPDIDACGALLTVLEVLFRVSGFSDNFYGRFIENCENVCRIKILQSKLYLKLIATEQCLWHLGIEIIDMLSGYHYTTSNVEVDVLKVVALFKRYSKIIKKMDTCSGNAPTSSMNSNESQVTSYAEALVRCKA